MEDKKIKTLSKKQKARLPGIEAGASLPRVEYSIVSRRSYLDRMVKSYTLFMTFVHVKKCLHRYHFVKVSQSRQLTQLSGLIN